MGNTCKPMAVSFRCMTKSTTNKKKKERKKKENSYLPSQRGILVLRRLRENRREGYLEVRLRKMNTVLQQDSYNYRLRMKRSR